MFKMILGVPRIQQRGPGWCGHATLAMVLRFWGYNIHQEDIYEHLKPGREVKRDDEFGFGAYVTMGELALAAMQLTNLRVTLASMKLYEKMWRKKDYFNPYDLLRESIVRGVPCIMHHIDHFYVVYGFSDMRRVYFLKDSRYMGPGIRNYTTFEYMWSRWDFGRIDTRYSLLIIRPKT